MSQKRLILTLWVATAVLALGYFLSGKDDGYREYAATSVTAPVAAPAALAKPPASPAQQPEVVVSGNPASSRLPGISLGGVSALIADSTRVASAAPSVPMTADAKPAAADETSKDSKLVGTAGVWRRASTVPQSEIEAAIQRDEMTPEAAVAFRSACGHDHDLHFDAKGKPLYACSMKIQVGPDTTPITSTPSYPLEDTFKLHSRPAATRKIYLDFDGHVTQDTPWNAGRSPTLTTPPFSLDGSADFSDAEKAVVQESFRRIAEHFAPWNVDVTTEDPGVEGLRKTSSGDLAYGIRVVIGPKAFDTSAAGIAYLNSFSDTIDNPCFTFATTGWSAALIAGVNANQKQDNLVAISNNTSGIPLIPDDHGGTLATATIAPGTSLTGGGIISNGADVDMIKIAAGKGALTITPKVALTAPNLRLQIKVLNSTGATIGTYEGAGTAGNMAPAPISVALPAEGFYYIQMDGIGNGTGVTEGYTDYGSIGYYSLVAAWPEQGNRTPIADATLTTPTTYDYATQPGALVNFNGTLSNDPDGLIIRYLWNFNDVYPRTATGPVASHRYKAPGVYRPTLTVVDDLGASATTSVTVTVTGPTVAPSCSLQLISGSFARLNSVSDVANATILVQDQYGNPLRRALVNVTVSGMVSAPRVTIRTNEFGQVSVTSPKFKRGARGTIRFDVSSVVSATHPYVPADNDVPAFVTLTR